MAQQRVANELSAAQINRAFEQGDALARYIFDGITREPTRLGIAADAFRLAEITIDVLPTGHLTSSGSSADLRLGFYVGEVETLVLPISLKAYKGSVASLGSKGARASLCRFFLNEERVTDATFVEYFGTAAESFVQTLADFKRAATEFYVSAEGLAFIDEYERRKGYRKVNNPLRRKEVGDHFERTRGFKSEHRFADLYVQMFQHGMNSVVTHDSTEEWHRFIRGARFVLGMENDILTLNAISNDLGVVEKVENSHLSDAYAALRRVLAPGCVFVLAHKPGSSIIGVRVRRGPDTVRCLTLAIWKDATIQFKLDSAMLR